MLVAHISESHFVKLLIIMQCQARVPFLRSPLLLLRGCHSAPNFSTYTQEHVIRPINLCNSNQNDLWPTLSVSVPRYRPSAAEFPLNPSLSTVCPCRNRLSWRKGVHCVTCSCVPWAIKVWAHRKKGHCRMQQRRRRRSSSCLAQIGFVLQNYASSKKQWMMRPEES